MLERKRREEAASEELEFKHVSHILQRVCPDLDNREVGWVLECSRHAMVKSDDIWKHLQKNQCADDVITNCFKMLADENGGLDMHKVLDMLQALQMPTEGKNLRKSVTRRLLEEARAKPKEVEA